MYLFLHIDFTVNNTHLKNERKTVQIEDIMYCSTLSVAVLKSSEIKTFIMGYHACKSILIPAKDEQLHAAIQPTNLLDKYAVGKKRVSRKRV